MKLGTALNAGSFIANAISGVLQDKMMKRRLSENIAAPLMNSTEHCILYDDQTNQIKWVSRNPIFK